MAQINPADLPDMPIDRFSGEHRFLSNFWPCPWVELDGMIFATVEHAYQAAKTTDATVRYKLQQAPTPTAAKRLGRTIRPLRADWEAQRLGVMKRLLRQKFAEKNLRGMLRRTAPRKLIEGNSWGDRYWGVCNGVGENNLGRLLEQIRVEVG